MKDREKYQNQHFSQASHFNTAHDVSLSVVELLCFFCIEMRFKLVKLKLETGLERMRILFLGDFCCYFWEFLLIFKIQILILFGSFQILSILSLNQYWNQIHNIIHHSTLNSNPLHPKSSHKSSKFYLNFVHCQGTQMWLLKCVSFITKLIYFHPFLCH